MSENELASDYLAQGFISQESERTYKLIKQLNKQLDKAKTRAEKDAIEAKMAAAKDEWWNILQPTFISIREKMQAEFLQAMYSNHERLCKARDAQSHHSLFSRKHIEHGRFFVSELLIISKIISNMDEFDRYLEEEKIKVNDQKILHNITITLDHFIEGVCKFTIYKNDFTVQLLPD